MTNTFARYCDYLSCERRWTADEIAQHAADLAALDAEAVITYYRWLCIEGFVEPATASVVKRSAR